MQTLYISLDLWDILENTYAEPPEEATSESWSEAQQKIYKENIQRDASALRYLQQGVSKTIFPRIFGAKKAKEAWDILQQSLKGDDKVTSLKLQSLWRDFDNMAIEEGDGMQSFLSKVAEIVNQIRSLGDVIEELHEERLNRSSNQPVDQAFQSKLHISDKKSSRWQGGRGGFNNKGKRCKSCKNTDHSYSKCPRKNKDDKDEANFSKHEEDQLFSCMNGQKEFENVWYVDSACRNHMCGDRSIFVEIDTNHYSKIKLGDGSILEARGKGAIDVNKNGGNQKLIKDVLFVPSITQNLLSVGQLMQKGYRLLFDDNA
ncbi:PREDICTED: uncharacterized protein LOC105954897 [Erythranthe guttata]|uniref:uncharacterized protein LOC105954897 n=1 Tax=Erythranthe guttata TaxID=4155 RepID=UPI00064E032A|nr:PREDICTED: uncharacterized protein LOC105954897 [Erythranthe guttata]|eukprot:XP_012834035.1 PREDICTED: uncharacterized protein LOC105954897 [Erythranthe guttata]